MTHYQTRYKNDYSTFFQSAIESRATLLRELNSKYQAESQNAKRTVQLPFALDE